LVSSTSLRASWRESLALFLWHKFRQTVGQAVDTMCHLWDNNDVAIVPH